MKQSSVKKFLKLEHVLDSNFRIHDFIQYYGAHTGRFRGTGIQIHNLPRESSEDEEAYLNSIDKIKNDPFFIHDAIKKSLRQLIVPRNPNHFFIVADYSSIENRVIAWLFGETQALEDFKSGKDEYLQMASKIFKKPISEIEKDQRQLSKAVVLGCQFGMSAKTLQATCENWGIDISLPKAKELVNIYRTERPNIVRGWSRIMDLLEKSLRLKGTLFNFRNLVWFHTSKDGDLRIKLPSDRVLFYRQIKEEEVGYKYTFVSSGKVAYLSMNLSLIHISEPTRPY